MSWMARVLSGVLVKENRGFLGILVAGKPEAVRAFRDKALSTWRHSWSRGSPELRLTSRLGFVSFKRGKPAESTKGSLYAYGRSLPNLSPLFLSPLVEFSG
jgi:hypothetical protein